MCFNRPIQVQIEHVEDVDQVFDGIWYCKGGIVVQMLRAAIKFSVFRDGLRHYVKEYAYNNTETINLLTAWEAVSQLLVGEIVKLRT